VISLLVCRRSSIGVVDIKIDDVVCMVGALVSAVVVTDGTVIVVLPGL
jgi:hypothetical protein